VSSDFVQAAGVFKAWEKWTNANGGINGHPVQVIVMNDQGTPSVGLSDVQTLINKDHVVALTSEGISSLGWLPTAEQLGVPVIGTGQVSQYGKTMGHKNVYIIDAIYPATWAMAMQAAKQLGGTKIGTAGDPAQGGTLDIPTFKAFASDFGMSFAKGVAAAATAPSYVAQCLALKQSGADTYQTPFETSAFLNFVDQCAAQGWHPVVVGQEAQNTGAWLKDPNFAKSGGSISSFPWFNTSVPAIATYNQVMQQYDPDALVNNPVIATQAWAIMQVFAGAAKAANLGPNATYAQLVSGLQTIKNDTFGGLTPPLTYANGGNLQPPTCGYIIKRDGSNWALLNNGQLLCVPYATATAIAKQLIGVG
jgi:branched-chain amino acid transport system substrate-binding protein